MKHTLDTTQAPLQQYQTYSYFTYGSKYVRDYSIPSFSPKFDINLIIFSIKEKAVATFCCLRRIVSSRDEELFDASYFK